jgi:hypothetical protein
MRKHDPAIRRQHTAFSQDLSAECPMGRRPIGTLLKRNKRTSFD